MVCSPGVSSKCYQLEARDRGTSQLSEQLQDTITFHTMHKNTSTTYPIPPLTLLSLSTSFLCSLLPLPLRFPFLSLPSPLPALWRYTHAMIEASSSWPLVRQHFLSRLWRLTLCPINSALRGLFVFFSKKKNNINLGCCLLKKPKDGL